MAESLKKALRQKRAFESLEQATFLSIQRTASAWMQVLAHRLKPFGLTPTQYNVLRILRGAHPGSLTCGEVGERMVTVVPDVTRLIDRLVARRLAWKGPPNRQSRDLRPGSGAAGRARREGPRVARGAPGAARRARARDVVRPVGEGAARGGGIIRPFVCYNEQ